jgi:hypothetical protein
MSVQPQESDRKPHESDRRVQLPFLRPAVAPTPARYRQPLRTPAPKGDSVLDEIDRELFWHKRTFMDALEAARHWRVATASGRHAFHSHQLTTMKYKRIEIARLLAIRRSFEDRAQA